MFRGLSSKICRSENNLEACSWSWTPTNCAHNHTTLSAYFIYSTAIRKLVRFVIFGLPKHIDVFDVSCIWQRALWRERRANVDLSIILSWNVNEFNPGTFPSSERMVALNTILALPLAGVGLAVGPWPRVVAYTVQNACDYSPYTLLPLTVTNVINDITAPPPPTCSAFLMLTRACVKQPEFMFPT